MKKTTLLFMLICSGTFICSAQKKGFNKADNLLNIGIGINSYYSNGIPIGASFEKAVSDVISVGANVDYLSSKYDYGYGYTYKFTAIYFGARGAYHFNELLNIDNAKIDLYGGATVGFRSFRFNDTYSYGGLGNSYGSGVFFGAFIGGRYYFNPKIGAFAEAGAIGSTNGRVGVSFKF